MVSRYDSRKNAAIVLYEKSVVFDDLPVLTWRDANILAKTVAEMADVGIAAGIGDLLQGHAPRLEQGAGEIDTSGGDPCQWRHAERNTEHARQMIFRQTGDVGQIAKCNDSIQ